MNPNKFLFLWCCIGLWCVTVQLHAQSIQGVVRDNTGQTLVGVSVYAKNSPISTYTNANGEFVLQKMPKGKYTFVWKYMGYNDHRAIYYVTKDSVYNLNIELKESTQDIAEVVVYAKSKAQRLREAVYKPDVISLSALKTSVQPVVELVSKAAGIRVRTNGGMGSRVNISLNGIGGKGVQTFIDGIPVELLGKGYELTNLPPNMIAQMAIYKGIVPVEFSTDSPGGVISISTPDSKQNYLDLSLTAGSWGTQMAGMAWQFKLDTAGRHSIKSNSFYSYSDNDYTMYNVEIITDALGNTELGTSPRFNDQYWSWLTNLEYNYQGTLWADKLKLVGTYSQTDKNLQHGLTAETPWGETRSQMKQLSLTTVWQKTFTNQLNASIILGGSQQQEAFVDTASKVYYWGPSSVPKQNKGEISYFENGRTPVLDITNAFGKTMWSYSLNTSNELKFNNLSSYQRIKTKDNAVAQTNTEVNQVPQELMKSVSGLAIESRVLDDDLVNVLSLKHFYTINKGEILKTNNTLDTVVQNRQSEFGFGNVLSYTLLRDWKVFAGYEHLYRLPERMELFGDGLIVGSNLNLKPENSQNINLGISLYNPLYSVLAKGFYRQVQNQIFLSALGVGVTPVHLNLHTTRILGTEIEGRYNPVRQLQLFGNITWQHITLQAVDEFGKIGEQYIGQKIPNTPTFFGNAGLNYGLSNRFMANDQLVLSYDLSYVHAFFLGWEQDGLSDTKATIPTQFVQNASLSYSLQDGRYALSLSVTNLANALAYDNFKVQKPGRSIFLKLRYTL